MVNTGIHTVIIIILSFVANRYWQSRVELLRLARGLLAPLLRYLRGLLSDATLSRELYCV